MIRLFGKWHIPVFANMDKGRAYVPSMIALVYLGWCILNGFVYYSPYMPQLFFAIGALHLLLKKDAKKWIAISGICTFLREVTTGDVEGIETLCLLIVFAILSLLMTYVNSQTLWGFCFLSIIGILMYAIMYWGSYSLFTSGHSVKLGLTYLLQSLPATFAVMLIGYAMISRNIKKDNRKKVNYRYF